MNRSTIFEFLRKDTDLELTYMKIGKGQYPVLRVPWKWDQPYLFINGWRIKCFQSVVLFSNELVVRFGIPSDEQINIPYKDIDYVEVCEDIDVRYIGLADNKKVYIQED